MFKTHGVVTAELILISKGCRLRNQSNTDPYAV